ncbi:MAG TPA: hypothetical protein VKU01_34605 [Bryobacteraceae bacterium]|nr:hypothetical protein [Bryobacteraceae bacterium]
MPRLFRRTKVISIRLSAEEYDQLQSLCTIKGADSISELARAGLKLLMLNEKSNGHGAIAGRVEAIDSRVAELAREVERLNDLMATGQQESR